MNKNCSNCGAGVTSAPEYNTASACGNPPTQLRTVTIPKNKGGDGPDDLYAPKLGAWQNTIVIYQKTGSVYLYDVNGIYTNLTGSEYGAQISNLVDQLGSLTQEVDTLSNSLADETSNRQGETANLQNQLTNLVSALAAETGARTAADNSLTEQLTAMQTQVNQIGAEVSDQGTATNTAIDSLQQGLAAETAAREQADASLQSSIATNTNDIAALQVAVGGENGGGLSQDVVYAISSNADVSTINLVVNHGHLNSTDKTETLVPLPVASAVQAGIINAETYESFQSNSDNVDALLNGAVAIDDLATSPSQDDLTEAWKTATGKDTLINRASILDTANDKMWYYYENTRQWVSIPTGELDFSISTATNSALGVVMGSTNTGQIAVETNGTMSVNGWDTQAAQVANNTTQIAALNTTIGTIQSVLTRLDSGSGV